MRSVTILCLFVLCSGAARADCTFRTADQTHTTLVIYRPNNQYGMLMGANVYLDDVRVCRLSNGKFLVATASPGQHLLRVGSEKNVPIDVKPGNAYYFRIGMLLSLCCKFQSGFHMQAVAAQAASAELTNLRPQNGQMAPLPVLTGPDLGVPVRE
jgi:hypothetical protein